MTITQHDKFLGAALTIVFVEGEPPRIGDRPIASFSTNDLRAYADLDLPGAGLGWWELTTEQAAELVAKAPRYRLAREGGVRPTVHLTGERIGHTACGRRDVPAVERTTDANEVTCEVCAEVEACAQGEACAEGEACAQGEASS